MMYFNLIDKLKEHFDNDPIVNTTTKGDIFKVDLSKQSIFPLSHLIINTVTAQESVLRFNISILAMDIVDESKEPTTDIFIGNNNEQDVLNTQLAVLNKLVQVLRRGDLYNDKYLKSLPDLLSYLYSISLLSKLNGAMFKFIRKKPQFSILQYFLIPELDFSPLKHVERKKLVFCLASFINLIDNY